MIPTGGGVALTGLLMNLHGYEWGDYVFFAGMVLVLFTWIDRYLTHHYPDMKEEDR